MELYFATSNPNKLMEAERILGMKILHKDIDLFEVQSLSAREVAEQKAREAFRILKKPVFVEDTALYIKSLNNFPGALIKWVVSTIGIENLPDLVGRDKSAYAETCVAFYDGKKMQLFIGRIDGTIAEKAKGKKNFNWDVIFIPKGHKETFGEMSMAQKNSISMRGRAFAKFKEYLKKKNEA